MDHEKENLRRACEQLQQEKASLKRENLELSRRLGRRALGSPAVSAKDTVKRDKDGIVYTVPAAEPPKMELAACYCTFKREEDSPLESGLAIATAHGVSDVVAVFPADAETVGDAVLGIWEYNLDWTQSLYPRGS